MNYQKMMSTILIFLLIVFSNSVLAVQNPTPLPIDSAFKLTVKSADDSKIELHWDIANGYHLYKDRFSFTVDKSNPKLVIGKINLPAGIPTHDDILGDYQVYTNILDIWIPIEGLNNSSKDVNLLVGYQGCSENNFCYPPIIKKITVNFNDLTRTGIESHHDEQLKLTSLQDKVTHILQEKNYAWIILVFIGLGILLAFTPCVLPMIPILSGIILGQNKKNITTYRAFFLSLSYVLGMSVTYAIAGVLVALAGSHLSVAFQSPIVIIAFSILFFLLALSLFGVYELRLPHFIQHKVLHLSHKQKSGSFIGATIMGALSVLVVSPCVTAPLVGVLTFIAQSGDVLLGSFALFALGLGMGLPLLIIGTTEGKFLPKSGHWMNVVKSFFGVLLIIVAISLLQRILTAPQGLMLWAIFLIIFAVYLGVGVMLQENAPALKKLSKAIGFILFAYGVILLFGAGMGNGDFLKPLRLNYCPTEMTIAQNEASEIIFQPVKTLSDVQKKLSLAKAQNQIVMLDFYANWCVACHEMDKNIFSDKKVKSLLSNVAVLRADVTNDDISDNALKKYFNVIAPPTLLFFDKNSNELSEYRIVGGSLSAEDFAKQLEAIKTRQSP